MYGLCKLHVSQQFHTDARSVLFSQFLSSYKQLCINCDAKAINLQSEWWGGNCHAKAYAVIWDMRPSQGTCMHAAPDVMFLGHVQ